MTVAALYVDAAGPYSRLPVDLWDEARDARTYSGPHRVIAHPPCGPWGRLRQFCKSGQADCAPIAVSQVRQFGGVLEHPAHSRLFAYCGLPRPGELWPDDFGGRTVQLYQSAYGHPAPKLTWLYYVGLPPCPFVHGWGGARTTVEFQSSAVRHLTPDDLAARLVQWVSA